MLTPELLTAFILFAFVSSVTPGPNNTMLLASGVNFGTYRTIPHMLGISIGFGIMVILVGFGFGTIFELHPTLYTIVRYAGVVYLLYLAWKIARSGSISDGKSVRSKPMHFFAAASFQWINPKAWMMIVAAVSTYAPRDHYFINICIIAGIFSLIIVPTSWLWTMFGSSLRRFLTNAKRLQIFNISMALLLVASLYPLI